MQHLLKQFAYPRDREICCEDWPTPKMVHWLGPTNQGAKWRSAPAHSDDGLTEYIVSDDVNVYAIVTVSGLFKWKLPVSARQSAAVQSSPLVYNQNIYVSGTDNNLYAIKDNGASGEHILDSGAQRHGVCLPCTRQWKYGCW